MRYYRIGFICVLLCVIRIYSESRLDTLFFLGDSALSIEWMPDSTNIHADWYSTYAIQCTGADSVYVHNDFIPGVTYQSIAYSYGGEDIYSEYRSKIDSGYIIGSHVCHYNVIFGKYNRDPSEMVAGTDCSGFVCRLWGVPRVNTTTLYSRYASIAKDSLKTGDILVKPGSHVVLIADKEDDTHYLIWESTSIVNGCRERVIDITDSYWDSYYPRRYIKLFNNGLTTPRQFHSLAIPLIRFHQGTLIINSLSPKSRFNVKVFTISGKTIYSGIYIHNHPIPLPAAAGILLVQLHEYNNHSSVIGVCTNR